MIVGANTSDISQRRAFREAIASATPRLPGQSRGAWADALRARDPGLSAADAAVIVGANTSDISQRRAFREAIASATPRLPGQSPGASADALREAEPVLSVADAAVIVRANNSDIARRRAFREAIASATPRLPGQSNRAWAAALRAAEPGLSAAEIARIVRA
ncbi:hypothetical protein ACC733_36780, partial [Rhizobium johnstonii]